MIDVLLNAIVLQHFSCKAIEENLGKSKRVPSIKWYRRNLWALDKKSLDPYLWMIALFSRVPYFLGILALLGPHNEWPMWYSSSLPQLFINFVPHHSPNGLGNSFSNQLYRYAKILANKIFANDFVVVDLGCPLKLADEFRHHHLRVFKEMVDAA